MIKLKVLLFWGELWFYPRIDARKKCCVVCRWHVHVFSSITVMFSLLPTEIAPGARLTINSATWTVLQHCALQVARGVCIWEGERERERERERESDVCHVSVHPCVRLRACASSHSVSLAGIIMAWGGQSYEHQWYILHQSSMLTLCYVCTCNHGKKQLIEGAMQSLYPIRKQFKIFF